MDKIAQFICTVCSHIIFDIDVTTSKTETTLWKRKRDCFGNKIGKRTSKKEKL